MTEIRQHIQPPSELNAGGAGPHARVETLPEPPCTCNRLEVDFYDVTGCELCDPRLRVADEVEPEPDGACSVCTFIGVEYPGEDCPF